MKTIEELVAQVAKNIGMPQKEAVAHETVKTVQEIPHEVKTAAAPIACDRTYAGTPANKQNVCNTGTVMTLELAKKAALAAEIAAGKIGINVVTAVCDAGANLVLLHAMDNSYIASVKAARDKAYTAVALKMPTHTALKESRGGALDGLTNGDGILLLGGGFPLEAGGKIYGSIGVSGGTKEQDILVAAAVKEVVNVLIDCPH